jgi:multidrug efflux pump subunit AcrA (membrane-fusion protein)
VTTMKFFKFFVFALAAGGLIFLSVGCSRNANNATPVKPTISTVQRGNITVAVIGTGNLALEYKQGLTFGQTGLVSQASNAKISEVLVKPGDTVKQGQILVKADTSDLENTLIQDQHALDRAKADLLTAENNLTTDQIKLNQQGDVQEIQTKVDNANTQLLYAQTMLQKSLVSSSPNASDEVQYWNQMIGQFNSDITKYQQEMANLTADPEHYLASKVNGSASSVAAIKNLQMQIEQDNSTITLRQNAVNEAQSTLDDHKNMAQEITAPFDGLITRVNVNVGDIKSRSDDLVEIAEPDKFIANIMVTERDVMSVKLDGDATVSFDAVSGLNFPAKIIQIAPLATIQQGVVNYAITVELTSTSPILPNRVGLMGQNSKQFAAGSQIPPVMTPGGMPSSGNTSPDGGTLSPSMSSAFTEGLSGKIFSSGSLQPAILRDGLSATVNIVIQESGEVLMVPTRAITRQGLTTTVQKVVGTGTEQTPVQIGITDGTNTEIISGLNEGDQVSIQPRSTSTTANQGLPAGGSFMIR